MILFNTIFEKSYLFNGILSAGGGLLILLALFFIVIRFFWKYIKDNLVVFIIIFMFFLLPSFPFVFFYLAFCGFIPAIIDGLIIVESPKQHIVEIIDKKIIKEESTTRKVRRTSHNNYNNYRNYSKHSINRSDSYEKETNTNNRIISEKEVNINDLTPFSYQRPDGTVVDIDYSFKIYVKKWWEGSDQQLVDFSIPKNDYEKYKINQKVYVKTQKGIFGMQHIVKDSDFLKLVKESDSIKDNNEKDMK